MEARAPDILPCTWVYGCSGCGLRTEVIMPQGQIVDEASYIGPCCRKLRVRATGARPPLYTLEGEAVAPPPLALLRSRGYHT